MKYAKWLGQRCARVATPCPGAPQEVARAWGRCGPPVGHQTSSFLLPPSSGEKLRKIAFPEASDIHKYGVLTVLFPSESDSGSYSRHNHHTCKIEEIT